MIIEIYRQLRPIIRGMKTFVVALALVLGAFLHAQDQSTCPGPRERIPRSSCTDSDVSRDIRVRVASIDTRHGAANTGTYNPAGSGGYASVGSIISPAAMSDTVGYVEQHTYRSCDINLELSDRVKKSFQRLGYFCADVEPIAAQQTGENGDLPPIGISIIEQRRNFGPPRAIIRVKVAGALVDSRCPQNLDNLLP